MRNTVNRKVNCETANINKTVNAAVKQTEDIRLIQEKMGFHNLNEGLAEIAELRLQYPEATLKELGTQCSGDPCPDPFCSIRDSACRNPRLSIWNPFQRDSFQQPSYLCTYA